MKNTSVHCSFFIVHCSLVIRLNAEHAFAEKLAPPPHPRRACRSIETPSCPNLLWSDQSIHPRRGIAPAPACARRSRRRTPCSRGASRFGWTPCSPPRPPPPPAHFRRG